MYEFVTHTWNTIKGRCSHDCVYCYMKIFKLNPVRIDMSEFKTDLGEYNHIFVGSSCDMFNPSIPTHWIQKTLQHCMKFEKNRYLFQSKNPARFHQFMTYPKEVIFCTTIETNRVLKDRFISAAPPVEKRVAAIRTLPPRYTKMLTIEPIMDFDLDKMVELIRHSKATHINIGADSKGHGLPEPRPEKIIALMNYLKNANFRVTGKENLNRILQKQMELEL